MASELASQAALGAARVYWNGAHATQTVAGRPFGSPLGKLHSEGLALLRANGWERVPPSDPRTPGFAFTTRKGGDFPATGPGLPRVRQFPQRCTAVLDDKLRLAQCLEAAGCADIAPRTWTDLAAFLEQHSAGSTLATAAGGSGHSSGSSGSVAAPAGNAAEAAASSTVGEICQLWFLKHRHGVKGRSVYPFTSLPSLLARLRSLSGSLDVGSSGHEGGSSGQRDSGAGGLRSGQPGGSGRSGGSLQQFVVQEGVAPPLLLPDGRKLTLRAHVLLLLEQAAGAGETATSPQHERQQRPQDAQTPAEPQQQATADQNQQGPRLRAWVHEDVIVTPHAAPAAAAAGQPAAVGPAVEADAAVHVSSRGRGHPKPFLLPQLSLEPQQQQQPLQQEQQEQQQQAQTLNLHMRQELWEQICSISRAAVAAGAQQGLVPRRADPRAVLYHLWAFDFAVASEPAAEPAAAACSGPSNAAAAAGAAASAAQRGGQGAPRPLEPTPRPRVLLLEANSYPAIASGTMAAVPRSVYTRLVGDLLGLVVLPALGGGGQRPGEGPAGGFVRML